MSLTPDENEIDIGSGDHVYVQFILHSRPSVSVDELFSALVWEVQCIGQVFDSAALDVDDWFLEIVSPKDVAVSDGESL